MTEIVRNRNPEIFSHVESIVVPGLFFNIFQQTITYKSTITPIMPLVFRLFLCLEFCAVPFGDCDEVQSQCWLHGGTDGALKTAIKKANQCCHLIGVRQTVNREKERIHWC